MGTGVKDTDATMSKLWLCLVRDFRSSLGHEYASAPLNIFRDRGIKGLREYKWPSRTNLSPYFFKADYQLENLFKRYRFRDDVFTDEELEDMAYDKFLATQERIAQPMQLTPLVRMWLQKARSICTTILGVYTHEEHFSLCRFGKRACVGSPYSRSYLDAKLGKPITGSEQHISWFNEYLQTDAILADLVQKRVQDTGTPMYEVCDSLTLTLVPKSFKAKRSILANTLIGSFATYGLGRVIQARLEKVNLNIRHLQEKHGVLAKINSVTRKLATADLSAASDSISRELLRMLLPIKWYQAVMLGSIPYVNIKGVKNRMSSVITMGMGHTFPLQTLVFYSLIKAIGELRGESSTFVSVYGDDLIYPSRLHRYVKVLFPMVHLHLNGDKTYVEDYFRESCGSDYCHGSDVRPHQPQGECKLVKPAVYASFLYKLLNGLLRRWDEVEIPQAVDFLLTELFITQKEVYQVPPSFPDGSGYRVDKPRNDYFFSGVTYATTTQTWVFKYLHVNPDYRVVTNLYPYYWERMRQSNNNDDVHEDIWDLAEDQPSIRWIRTKVPPKNYRSNITGRRLRHLTPVVSKKSATRLGCQTGSTSCWA